MSSDWENLPYHLLLSVIERFASQSEYLMLVLVCKPWHCVAKNKQSQLVARRLPTSPMLLIPNENGDTWKVYNMMSDKFLGFQVRLFNKRFCGSAKGWLITLENDFTVTLVNPFLRIKGKVENESSVIRLPRLKRPPHMNRSSFGDWLERCEDFIYKATISADPILDANNCIIMVTYRDKFQLAFFKLGKDTGWNYVDESRCYIEEVIHFKGKFYALQKNSQLFSFDISSWSSISSLEELISDKQCQMRSSIKQYLVSLNDKELLMVRRFYDYDWDGSERRMTKNFKIFKLDYDKHEWLEESTLGDGALFVGDNSTIYVLASSFPGCQPNCIYFTHDVEYLYADFGPYGSPHDFGIYNMKDQSVSQSALSKTLMENSLQRPVWTMPILEPDALL